MKEVLEVVEDAESGTTTVVMRVPGFENFGARFAELESMSAEAIFNAEDMDGMLGNALNLIQNLQKESMTKLQQQYEAASEGPEKERLKQMIEMLNGATKEFLSDDGDEEDGAEEEEEEAEFDEDDTEAEKGEDLQKLEIVLGEGISWDDAAEKRVDGFLAKWPQTRSKVQEALFQYYREFYPQVRTTEGEFPGEEIMLPEPSGPEVIADLFKISTVFLRTDGAIGLSGRCSWDDEHGFGILLREDKVVAAGYADEAYSDS